MSVQRSAQYNINEKQSSYKVVSLVIGTLLHGKVSGTCT